MIIEGISKKEAILMIESLNKKKSELITNRNFVEIGSIQRENLENDIQSASNLIDKLQEGIERE